ncbi:glycosyltransferase family 4 protein [Akkermansiaceae bacterium]|nr:glycosyltransferase family 4 protein [Akkermansiaceae bacterium]MDB4544314.1 glycosyltransferase family 4 protein [Akkermansiaceae bacterium]
MKKKNVLMLGWEFPPLINGGLGVACQGLSEALRKHVDLTLILPEQATLHAYHESQSDLYTGNLKARVGDYTRSAAEKAGHHQFEIIHAHDWMTFLAGLEIRNLTHKPLVLHIHSLSYDRVGPDCRDWIFEIEQHAMAQADSVIAVSEYTKSICRDHYKIDPNKIHAIHNGVVSIDPVKPPRDSPEKLVLFLGRMTRQKAPLNFLQIAAKVLEKVSDVRFVMAGTGDQLDKATRESLRLKIHDRVEFPGFIDRARINALFAMTDVYCMPSVSEPFGLSALEAAQFGIPTVISKQSGVAEVLPNSHTADHWDLDLMARHIVELLRDNVAHSMAAGFSQNDHQGHTWERTAALVEELYDHHLDTT